MIYKLDEKVVRDNILSKCFPEQRNIVTIEKNLVLYNHPPIKRERDIGPNCVVIQKERKFIAPSFKPIIKENYFDPGLIVWYIELLRNRTGWESNVIHREELYQYAESIVPYERIPVWDWELEKVNVTWMNYMNDVTNKFKWMCSVFHENLRINNSMSQFAENAKHNLDLFSFVIGTIAEASDLTELYNKDSGYISVAGYFKRNIIRDILFKVIQGIYYDFYSDYQYDLNGSIKHGHHIFRDKMYYFSEIVKRNQIIKGENLDSYGKRIVNIYANKLYDWYFPKKWEKSNPGMFIFRIDKAIEYSNKLRYLNKTRSELYRNNSRQILFRLP